MIKNILKKKLIVSSIILLLVLSLYLVPNNKNLNIEEKVEYVNYEIKKTEIYLLDKNNYLSRVMIPINSDKNIDIASEAIEILKCNGKYKDKIPNNFKCVLNSKTKILDTEVKDNTLKIDFNEALLDTDNEIKVIESIVYTLTYINNIDNIIIYINGELLTKLPKSNITLPTTLNRNIGINKKYELVSNTNIKKTTIYYTNTYDDFTYYVPVTLINNDSRDKIEIIIDELSNKILSNNLNSYLNSDTKLINSNIENDTMYVNFNENILNDFNDNNILEEVIYTISLSINDNYEVNNVFFSVNDKEIVKTTIKSLE